MLWATAERVHETKEPWDAAREPTPADELFFWMAFDACRADPELAAALRHKRAFANNPLCWITFPGEMVESEEPTPPDFQVFAATVADTKAIRSSDKVAVLAAAPAERGADLMLAVAGDASQIAAIGDITPIGGIALGGAVVAALHSARRTPTGTAA